MDENFYLILIGIVLLAALIFFLKNRDTSAQNQPAERGVSKDLYETIVAQNDMLRAEIVEKELEIRQKHAELAANQAKNQQLENNLLSQKAEIEQVQKRFQADFEKIANRLLEEKGQAMTHQNSQQLQTVLLPLREKIKEFETQVEQKFLEETREKSALKKELEQLVGLNQQLSRDAHNLAAALKGQSKTQGNWGEYQLELLLEKAGLTKGIHFLPQQTFRDDDGAAKRPDFIIQLPDNKQLILDAKVSLTAFERFYNDPNPDERGRHLRAHVESLRAHVANLSSKNYQFLSQINSPDYLLLFVPLENALAVALQADPKLLTDALEKNVILVTTSSLVATMRTVAHLWKQEKQARSVQEIARQSGLLYDKFVAFVDDLRMIGARLAGAQVAYNDAMNKLVNASRFGDTLVGRAEKIRELGAKSSKNLPRELLDTAAEVDLEIENG